MNFMMTQPVRSVPALLQEEFIRTREVIVEAENREGARRPMHNIVPRLRKTPGVFLRPAPAIGQHTADVRAELERLDSAMR